MRPAPPACGSGDAVLHGSAEPSLRLDVLAVACLLVAIFFLRDNFFAANHVLWLLAGLVVAISLVQNGLPPLSLRRSWPYTGYLAVLTVSCLLVRTPEAMAEYGRQILFLSVVFAVWRSAPPTGSRRVLLALMLVSTAIVLAQGVYSGLRHPGPERLVLFEDVIQWSGYPELGLLASMGAAATAGLLITSRRWTLQLACGLLAVWYGTAALLLYSRSAWVTIGLTIVWLVIVGFLRWRRHVALLLLGGLALAGVLTVLSVPLVSQYLETFREARDTTELEIRRKGWHAALAMVRDRPVIGVGPGMYPIVHSKYEEFHDRTHAYNIVLHQAAEVGLVGLFFYLAIWARVLTLSYLRAGPTLPGSLSFALHGMLLAFLVRSQSEHFLANLGTSPRVLLFLAVLMGLLEAGAGSPAGGPVAGRRRGRFFSRAGQVPNAPELPATAPRQETAGKPPSWIQNRWCHVRRIVGIGASMECSNGERLGARTAAADVVQHPRGRHMADGVAGRP
jgi:O-antigen ligase